MTAIYFLLLTSAAFITLCGTLADTLEKLIW